LPALTDRIPIVAWATEVPAKIGLTISVAFSRVDIFGVTPAVAIAIVATEWTSTGDFAALSCRTIKVVKTEIIFSWRLTSIACPRITA
jgi:hypothetical protein